MKIISKKDAILNNFVFYFTGKPCKHGHISERLVKGSSCRVCKNLYYQSRREKNREEYNLYCREKKRQNYSPEKRHKAYIDNIEKEMFYGAKRRAKIKNIIFTISKKDIIIPNCCPVLGIPLDRRDKQHTPTLDRIINENGYTKNNVQVISFKANTLKNNGTIEDFEKIIDYMKKNIEIKV
jgi:hypothetical protein